MEYNFEYSKNVEISTLRRYIEESILLIINYIVYDKENLNLKIIFERELTINEETILNNILSNYDNDYKEYFKRDRHVLIKSLYDFPVPTNNVITLENNTSYEINGSVNIGPNRIESGISNIIYGVDKSDDKLISMTTDYVITNGDNDFSIDKITIAAPLGHCLNYHATIPHKYKTQISDCIFANSKSVGNVRNYNDFVFQNNLIINNENGINFSNGTNSNIFFLDNVVQYNGSNFVGLECTSGTIHTLYIDRCMFEVNPFEQIALKFSEDINFLAGAIISNCSFVEGSTSGNNYLVGVNGNSPNWTISRGNNINVPGLYKENITICIGAYSTTSTSFGEIPETHVIKTKDFYEPKSKFMKGKLTAAVSHQQNGQSVEIDLYNLTDSVSVSNSTLNTLITSSNVYQIVESVEFDLAENKEYRVRIRRSSGSGQNGALIRSATLELLVY